LKGAVVDAKNQAFRSAIGVATLPNPVKDKDECVHITKCEASEAKLDQSGTIKSEAIVTVDKEQNLKEKTTVATNLKQNGTPRQTQVVDNSKGNTQSTRKLQSNQTAKSAENRVKSKAGTGATFLETASTKPKENQSTKNKSRSKSGGGKTKGKQSYAHSQYQFSPWQAEVMKLIAYNRHQQWNTGLGMQQQYYTRNQYLESQGQWHMPWLTHRNRAAALHSQTVEQQYSLLHAPGTYCCFIY
jgi:hypothetical protein